MKFLSPIFYATLLLMAVACSDTTDDLGTIVMPGTDNVTAQQVTFPTTSRSLRADSVLAYSGRSHLGRIVDPETGLLTTCGFLAQFHLSEDFKLPSTIVRDENGAPICDSIEIRLFYDSYVGDSLTTMKMLVQELDTASVMEENVNYYTNLDPAVYLNPATGIRRVITFTARDLNDPSTAATSRSHRNIRIRMPQALGQRIMNKYFENPAYFRNSYEFLHHVCAGFLFKIEGGLGLMLNSNVATIDLCFRYAEKLANGNDTIVDGLQRLAATSEVIQNTYVESSLPDSLFSPDNDYTYIKSPAGIFTEFELPIDSIYSEQHRNDTVNAASVTFRRYNSTVAQGALDAPQNIVMLRKANVYKFFETEHLPDGVTSYSSTLSQNSYAFPNIAQLVATIKAERDTGADIQPSDTQAQRRAKYDAWQSQNPDWNKVVLVPVSPSYIVATTAYSSTMTLARLRNDLSLSSVRLVGGQGKGPELTVIYTRFE